MFEDIIKFSIRGSLRSKFSHRAFAFILSFQFLVGSNSFAESGEVSANGGTSPHSQSITISQNGYPELAISIETVSEDVSSVVKAASETGGLDGVQIIASPLDRLDGLSSEEMNHVHILDPYAVTDEAKSALSSDPHLRDKILAAKKAVRRSELRNTLKTKKAGLMVSIGTASIVSGISFFFSRDLPIAAQLFGAAFVVNGFQIMATDLWQKYLRGGGNLTLESYKKIGKFLGAVTVEPHQTVSSIGRLLAAYAFNTASASLMLGIQGSIENALMVAFYGLIGSWDAIWDIVFDRYVELGTITNRQLEKLIRIRLTLSPTVEALVMTGSPYAGGAAVVMMVVGGTGLLGMFSADRTSEFLKSRVANPKTTSVRSTSWWEKIKSRISKGKSVGQRSCQDLLSPSEG